jgi:hypothetical protein
LRHAGPHAAGSDDAKPAGAAALTGFAVGRNFVSLDDDLQLSFL